MICSSTPFKALYTPNVQLYNTTLESPRIRPHETPFDFLTYDILRRYYDCSMSYHIIVYPTSLILLYDLMLCCMPDYLTLCSTVLQCYYN